MDPVEPPKKRTKKQTEEPSAPRVGRDGRLQMLVYMLPTHVDELKGFAIDDRRPVSDIIEELVASWIKRRRQKTTKSKRPHVAREGRRQMLVYMSRENIRELKRFAMDDGRPAYDIIEKLVETWLKKRRKQK
jgi:hypothetical protein